MTANTPDPRRPVMREERLDPLGYGSPLGAAECDGCGETLPWRCLHPRWDENDQRGEYCPSCDPAFGTTKAALSVLGYR